jgi:hypothetical protein
MIRIRAVLLLRNIMKIRAAVFLSIYVLVRKSRTGLERPLLWSFSCCHSGNFNCCHAEEFSFCPAVMFMQDQSCYLAQDFSCCISATAMLKILLLSCSGLYDNMARIGAAIMLKIRAAFMVMIRDVN